MGINTATVQKLYVAFFNRPADVLGLSFWESKIAGGMTEAQIAASFATSSEYTSLFTNMNQLQIVSTLYSNLFGRTASLAEANFWAQRMLQGLETVDTIALTLANSAQGTDADAITNKVTAATSFTDALDTLEEATNYSGSAANAVARTWLATVTDSADSLTSATASVDATITASVTAGTATQGQTLTLTTGTNIMTGSSGADTFDAALSSAGGLTFNPSDSLDGGSGNDILSVTLNAAGTHQAASLKSIESISATFTTAASTLSLTGATGYTSVEAQGSTVAAAFSGINSTSVALKASNTAADVEFGFVSSALAGSADAVTVTVSNVNQGAGDGIELTAGVETLNLVSSGSANVVDEIESLTTDTITKVVVTGDQNLTITDALEASVATLDASAATGAVTATLGAVAAATVTGGSGNDSLTVSAVTGAVSVNAGAGNDTVTVATNLTTADTLAGGDGTDTLVTTNALTSTAAYTTPSTRTITGFETLRLTDAADAAFDVTDIDTGITKVVFAVNGANTSADVEFGDGASTLEIGRSTTTAAALATAITVDALNATALDGDSLTIANKNLSTVDAFGTANITSTDFETLTIDTGSYATAVAQTVGTISVTGSTNFTKAETVKFTGANNVTAGIITADIIDGSGLTSTTGTTLTTVTGTTATTVTGSAGNDVLVADTTNNVSVSGGAGNDAITGGAGNDVLAGDAGNDTITAAAGNDTVTGGAGNDTFVFDGNLTSADSIDGGDGAADVLSINNASLTAVAALAISQITTLNDRISNVERVTISDTFNQGTAFDMARLDNISTITLADGITGDEAITGLANGATVIATADNNADTDILTLTLSDSTGSADTLNYTMTQAATDDYGVLAVSGVETLNITANEATANAAVRVATLGLNITTATAGTTVNFAGTETITIDTVIAAQTINSTTTGAFIMTNTTGSGLAQTFTTGAGNDTIYAGGGADTVSAGAGTDSIVGGSGADNITGGDGADTIVGGSGNDTITLTETTAAVDDVVLDFSEGGASIDTIVGFTTGATGDEIQLDLSALESVVASGGIAAATDFAVMADGNSVAAAASVVQVMTASAAAAAGANVFVLQGSVFSDNNEVEDALEAGGAYALTGLHATVAQNDAFIVVWTNGTDVKISAVHMATETADDGDFEANDLNAYDLATISGVSSIGASTFAAGNFEWIA